MDKVLRRLLLMYGGGTIGCVLSTGIDAPVGVVVYLGIVGMLDNPDDQLPKTI